MATSATAPAKSPVLPDDPVQRAIKSLHKWTPIDRVLPSKKDLAVMPIPTYICWIMGMLLMASLVLVYYKRNPGYFQQEEGVYPTGTNTGSAPASSNVSVTPGELYTLPRYPNCQCVDFQINGSTRVVATPELQQLPGKYQFLLHKNYFTIKTDGGMVQNCGGKVKPEGVPTGAIETGITVEGQGKFSICKRN